MKRLFLLLIGFLTFSAQAQKLSAVIDYRPYCDLELDPYLEVSSFIDGNSVRYVKNQTQMFEADVRITIDIKKEGQFIKKVDYLVSGEQLADTTDVKRTDFWGVKRISLPNGTYNLAFTIQDMNNEESKVEFVDLVKIQFPKDTISISGINLHEHIAKTDNPNPYYDKYGYTSVPLLYNYLPSVLNKLYFSAEIYNTEKGVGPNTLFMVRSTLRNLNTKRQLSGEYTTVKRMESAPLVYYVSELDITQLYTGNYLLTIEVYGKDSILVATSQVVFERQNDIPLYEEEFVLTKDFRGTFVEKITDVKQMREHIACLLPIASISENNFIRKNVRKGELQDLQQFFYGFWYLRNDENPEEEWLKYYEKIKYVDKLYTSGNMKGYRTDRGRVFLQYGPPSTVYEAPFDSHSYPYEIWTYAMLESQSNVRFIFYNVDLVSKNYELLHSDKIGEVQDPFWKVKLVNRKTPIYNFDDKSIEQYYGNTVEDDWFYMK